VVRRSCLRWSMAMAAALDAGLAPGRASSQEPPAPSSEPAASPAPSPSPATPPPLPLVPDSTFSAVRGQRVILTTRTGAHLRVLVLSSDEDSLIVATVPNGVIAVVAKREVFDIRVVTTSQTPLAPPASRQPEPPPAPAPPHTHHFGLEFGVVPSAMVDLDYGHFLGFANVSILLPFISANAPESGFPFAGLASTQLWAFAIGVGFTSRLLPTSRWQYDLFAIGGGSNWSPGSAFAVPYGAGGAGVGLHVTLDRGFTLGIKAPVLGYGKGASGGGTPGVATFFSYALAGMPLLSFGYRF
jgi:hypothetical protein